VIGSAANKLAVDLAGKVAVPDTQKVDIETIKTRAVTCGAGVIVGPYVGNSTAAIAVDASGYVTYANAAPPTAAANATAVWTDLLAGTDFVGTHVAGLTLHDTPSLSSSSGWLNVRPLGYHDLHFQSNALQRSLL
jgi:hypothetical protein